MFVAGGLHFSGLDAMLQIFFGIVMCRPLWTALQGWEAAIWPGPRYSLWATDLAKFVMWWLATQKGFDDGCHQWPKYGFICYKYMYIISV